MKNLTKRFYSLFAVLMIGLGISQGMDLSPMVGIGAAGAAAGIYQMLPKSALPHGVALMAIDVSDVVTEHGAVYKDSGQGVKDILLAFRQPTVTDALFMPRPTKETILHKSSASITSVLQRFQKAFTAKGDTTFVPRSIQLQKLKIDLEEVPDDLEQDWHGFLAANNLSRKDWPFVKWWIEKLIIPQSLEDWELDEVYKGVQGAITPGTPTAAGAQIDGIRKIINDFITAGDTSTIATGALSSDPETFVDQVEAFVDAIPRKYRRHLNPIAMNEDQRDLFRDGMDIKYNTNYQKTGDLLKVRHSNIPVMGLPSMAGDEKLWTTVKGNSVMGYKKPENSKVFKVEESKRSVSVMTDFYKTPGFWVSEWIFTNDRDLV